MPAISATDRATLRSLASRYRDLCASDRVRWSRQQRQRLVDLQPTERPLVAVQPEGATAELMGEEVCTCAPELRDIEYGLRERIRRAEFLPDDIPWTPTVDVGWRVADTGRGVEIPQHHGDNPTPVCGEFREPAIREDLATTLRLCGHRPLCFVLKDTHTVQGEPGRLRRWVELAREEIALAQDRGLQPALAAAG